MVEMSPVAAEAAGIAKASANDATKGGMNADFIPRIYRIYRRVQRTDP